MLYTFRRLMAAPAPLTKPERIIVYADTLVIVPCRKLSGNYLHDLSGSTGSYRAAVHNE